ncbi:MAG TPA: hypothetical protein VHO01_07555 [Jatrophihabitans sp.]|nr:hypothetical protein [Jatrophihabitans sp.]
MTSMRKAELGFWMNLPPGWLPLDPRSSRIPEQVEQLLERRVAEDPQVAAHRGQIEQQLRHALKLARSQDLSFAAILATFTEDGLPIAASLALTRHRTPDGVQAHQVLAELGEQRERTNTLFDIPFIGTAVRSEYLDRTQVELPAAQGSGAPAGVGTAEVAVYQYYIGVPNSTDLIIATGATPTLPMREVFAQLFDAIISTFQFVDEGPDTGGK